MACCSILIEKKPRSRRMRALPPNVNYCHPSGFSDLTSVARDASEWQFIEGGILSHKRCHYDGMHSPVNTNQSCNAETKSTDSPTNTWISFTKKKFSNKLKITLCIPFFILFSVQYIKQVWSLKKRETFPNIITQLCCDFFPLPLCLVSIDNLQ